MNRLKINYLAEESVYFLKQIILGLVYLYFQASRIMQEAEKYDADSIYTHFMLYKLALSECNANRGNAYYYYSRTMRWG